MSDQGLEKQVVPPREGNPEMVALKRKIDVLQVLYIVLFFSSLLLIVVGFRGVPFGNVAWAVTLGGSVVVRLIRQSMVRSYNRILTGGAPPQLT
jgi:hypothetical protein